MSVTDEGEHGTSDGRKIAAERVHVDVPRVLPRDMVTSQVVDPPPDPDGGRGTDMEFTTRNGGW